MHARSSIVTLGTLFAVASLTQGCGGGELHVAGSGDAASYVESFARGPASVKLGHMRLKADDCTGIDLTPSYRPLDADDLVAFLKAAKLDVNVTRARTDLVFVDVTNAGTQAPLRLRIAILETAGAAGHDLHEALLEHGEGSWGVHRQNLAVLAPKGTLDDVVTLSVRTKLACWGVLTITGHDDTYVLPGGYAEL